MTDDKIKKKLLEDILRSSNFKSSEVYQKLLKYLVEASINNTPVKEYTIAVDVLNKGDDFNPSEDSSVRVYVSKLRKKIENYYLTEGKDSKICIAIPKGHYHVEFVSSSRYKKEAVKKFRIGYHTAAYTVFGLIIIILGVLLYLQSTHRHSKIPKEVLESPIWEDLLETRKEILLVAGNDLFFLEGSGEKETIVRRHTINKVSEFLQYKSKNPDISNITSYAFYPTSSIIQILEISGIISELNNFVFTSSYKLTARDIAAKNIVFLGSFRNLYLLERALQNSIEYEVKIDSSYFRIKDKDSSYTFIVTGTPSKEHEDYCLVRKIPGPHGNILFLYITFFQTGIYGAGEYMTNPDNIERLETMFRERYGEMPQYFDIVFKTRGFSRTAYKTTVEYFRKMDPEELSIW
jgi:hypothetical protein